MTETRIKEIAESLTEAQSRALHDALYTGACKRHDENLKETRRQWCVVKHYGHNSVRPNVIAKLDSLGLIARGSYFWILTARGMKVARHIWATWLGDYEQRDDQESVPTTVEEFVAMVRDEHADRERAHVEQVKKAKRLWRGLKLANANLVDRRDGNGHYWTTAVSSSIADTFGSPHHSYRSSLDLDLDDLIAIGEGIEEIRKELKDAAPRPQSKKGWSA